MRNYFLLFVLALLLKLSVNAQQANSYGMLYTSIPLFKLEYKGMVVPIVLEYSSLGVKVDELPGWTGTSWTLNTGYIDRNVLPELEKDGTSPDEELHPFYDGLSDYPEGSFFGGSYSIFDVTYGKITANGNCYTSKDGIKYYFGQDGAVDSTRYIIPSIPTEEVSRKHLTKMLNSQEGDAEILFNYMAGSTLAYLKSFQLKAEIDLPVNETASVRKDEVRVLVEPQILNSIECEDWKLEFITQESNFTDRGVRLNELRLFDGSGNLVSKYVLNYSEVECNSSLDNYFGYYSSTMSSEENTHRLFLTSVEKYNSGDIHTQTWSMEYYSPGLLPERISYKQNAWGYFTDYTYLGSKFYELSDIVNMPEITYHKSSKHSPISKWNEINDVLRYLPQDLFNGADPIHYEIYAETDKGRNTTNSGMLKSIEYPLGKVKTFNYSTRPYGNLLANITETDNREVLLESTYFQYEEGAIPYSGWNYILEYDVDSLPIKYYSCPLPGTDEMYYCLCGEETPDCDIDSAYDQAITDIMNDMETYEKTKLISFSAGCWYAIMPPAFKIVSTITEKQGLIVDYYRTAADAGCDNLPGELFGGSKTANGRPTSLQFLRGKKLEQRMLDAEGNILSRTQWKYMYPAFDSTIPSYLYKESRLGHPVTSKNFIQSASYFREYRAFNPATEEVKTSYEYNLATGKFEPVDIRLTKYYYEYSSGSGESPMLYASKTKDCTPGNENNPERTKSVNYFYPKSEQFYDVSNHFTEDQANSFEGSKPFMVYNYVNEEFVGGAKLSYEYTSGSVWKEYEGFLGYRANFVYGYRATLSDGGTPNSLPGTYTGHNSDDGDDEIIVIMDYDVFMDYGYSSYTAGGGMLIYSALAGTGFVLTDYVTGEELYTSYGTSGNQSNGLFSYQPDRRYVAFSTTGKLLSQAHTHIDNNSNIESDFNEFFSTRYPQPQYAPGHITWFLAKEVFYSNADVVQAFFNLDEHFSFNKTNLVSSTNQLSYYAYTYSAVYGTEERWVSEIIDNSIVKVQKIKPTDCTNCNGGPIFDLSQGVYQVPDYLELQTLQTFLEYDEDYEDYPQMTIDEKGVITTYLYYADNKIRYKVVNAHYRDVGDGPYTNIRNDVPNAYITEYKYDEFGRKSEEIDPNGNSESYLYDADGRLYQVIDNDGNIIKQYEYSY